MTALASEAKSVCAVTATQASRVPETVRVTPSLMVRTASVSRMTLQFAAMVALVPTLVENLAMPGVIVSYGVGALLILTGLFRQYLTLSMMRNNPEVKENEEITYYFGNAGIRAVRDGQEENMGFYKAVYRIWEDEKTFYVGMNEDDLLILPKDRFEEGSAEDFREFLVDKSGADYRWKPLGLVNRWKDFLTQTKNRITYLQMEARERDRNQKGKK